MSALQWANTIVIALGIPTIVGVLIFIGKKLHLLDSLEETATKIKHNMQVVSTYLTRHHTKFDPSELQAYSPLQLTGKGKDLILSMGFENVFQTNQKDFFDFIDSEKPKLKYDVEIISIKSIYAMNEKPYMDFLKVYLYNNPTRTMENTAPTLGVYIRDKYLEKHPEITQ